MQTISSSDLAHRLRPLIARLGRRLRQGAGGELSPSQGAALTTIAAHGPLTPSELAARERIQRPTATRVLARLEEAGLVARTGDPAHRRSPLVSTTPDRHELLRAVRERQDAHLARQLDPLFPEDPAALPPPPAPQAAPPPPQAPPPPHPPPRPPREEPGGGGGVPAAAPRTSPPLSAPTYRRYFSGQIVSITGNWMQTVGEMWLMVKLTGSG